MPTKVEKIHAGLYQQMLDNLEGAKDLTATMFALYAAIPRRKKRPKLVQYAALKGRCLRKLIDPSCLVNN